MFIPLHDANNLKHIKAQYVTLALIGINVMQPNYYDAVMETEYFIPACLVVAGFLATNYFFMKMMVNIKV